MRTSSRVFIAHLTTLAAGASALLVSSAALAQDSASVNIQNFNPIAGPNGVFSVEGADTAGHLAPVGGLVFNYSSEPLVAADGDDTRAVVNQQLATHIQAGVGLTQKLQVDLSAPLYLVNDVRWQGENYNGFAMGDLQLRAKGNILSNASSPLGLGFQAQLDLPTGKDDRFVGGDGVSVTPKLIADVEFGPVYIGANLGAKLRQKQELRNLTPGSAFTYGVGGEVSLLDGLLGIGGEVYGNTQLSDFFGDFRSSPLEGIVGVKLHTPSGFTVATGAGGGLISGFGSPAFRSFIGLSWQMPEEQEEVVDAPIDADGDGIPSDMDRCPDQPEDIDQFEDEDGCPEADNDGDGVLDISDQCPMEAAPDQEDGCPLEDTDGDGVMDPDDRCLDEAGPAENEGCPEEDTDGDGILDRDDKCPDEAGVAEEAGCPKPKRVTLEDKTIRITERVYFETGKATILERSFPLLDEVAAVLVQYPRITRLEVAGHTDSAGKDKANQKLSQERAESVVAYLIAKGVAKERLVAKGYGESKPLVAPEATPDDAARNRRVEFHILEQKKEETPTE